MARSTLSLSLRNFLLRVPLLRKSYRVSRDLSQKAFGIILQFLPSGNSFLSLPRGFYSGAELLSSGCYEGRVFFKAQRVPSFSEDSLVKRCGLGQDGFQPWQVFWMRIPDANLTGRSLVPRDRNGNLLAEATFSQTGDRADPAFNHLSIGKGRMIQGNATSLVSRWGGDAYGNKRYGGAGYWHWLFDSVARLSLLDHFPSDTMVITPPLAPWMRWFLERLGLGERIIETEATALQIENFYFSTPSSMTGCWNPYAVNFLRRSFLPFGSPPSDLLPKRFYILREGYTRKIANESDLRELFTSLGWALIAPEKLSIPDQIALFRDAEAIAGLHGSALTNLIWSSPGTSVLEFVPDCFMSGAFEWLSLMNQLPHRFLLCQTNNWGDTVVNLSALAKLIESTE